MNSRPLILPKGFPGKPLTGKCLYYFQNGLIIFAESDDDQPDVKKTGDGDYSFDCDRAVALMIAPGQPTNAVLMRDCFPGRPTFYIASKTDVRGISDMTDEGMLKSLRATRAGLVMQSGLPPEAPEQGKN